MRAKGHESSSGFRAWGSNLRAHRICNKAASGDALRGQQDLENVLQIASGDTFNPIHTPANTRSHDMIEAPATHTSEWTFKA